MRPLQMLYLEIHNEKDGVKQFKCNTRYDWYVMRNETSVKKTVIMDQEKVQWEIDLSEWDFVPNCKFELVKMLLEGDEKVELIFERSSYGADKKWMKSEQTDTHIYPCVYSINRQNECKFKWSEINSNGMFGVPKVVFGSGATGFVVDREGKYGLTQWAAGIKDDIENLDKISQVLQSPNFKKIVLATSVSKAEINKQILSCFRKDFWKFMIE